MITKLRRIAGFDLTGMASLALWVARRRHGVPPGATAVPYSGAQTAMTSLFLFAMVVELFAVEILLRAFDAPAGLRAFFLFLDGYTVLAVLAVIASCVTRPHVVSPDGLRIRYGAFLDVRVPRERIASVRKIRRFDENGHVGVTDGRLAVAVASQTNVLIELTRPITIVRPLGARAEVHAIRFYADVPGPLLAEIAAWSAEESVRVRPDLMGER
ncbi:hypothetical protein [Actinomadura macrotermitis]|uniref:Uncharacterized protein n=1 Tax=Actinomadura macrotermitis TaxID=2585200 RepID=A0A7K0C066_9ACTN|nr:hypothetical protein [Actinomadura macrotermitis]MQY06821.1 hypothetical protein [Actinomadura macrotermitis]